jgi:hypothetical protein
LLTLMGASGVASAFNNAVMNRAKVRCGDAKMNDVLRGAVAQLGERIVRNDEAAGSIPASSTKYFRSHPSKGKAPVQ